VKRSEKLSIHWQREILSKIKVIRERHWRLIAAVSVGMVLLCLAGLVITRRCSEPNPQSNVYTWKRNLGRIIQTR
jgi:hypothetical protein